LKFTVAQKNEAELFISFFSSTGAGPRKYLQPVSEATQKSDGGINYTHIRYAEVLLWEAEALAELGQTSDALGPLEEVRARLVHKLQILTTLPAVDDQQQLIDIIRHERRASLI
jgi:hypothetical protein